MTPKTPAGTVTADVRSSIAFEEQYAILNIANGLGQSDTESSTSPNPTALVHRDGQDTSYLTDKPGERDRLV
jgi:hypothetical protein